MKPNLSARDLEALIALAQTLNFNRASSRLHLSQSAFSSVIARLEETLGSSLVTRTTRNVSLTHAGEVFVSHAETILRDMQRMVDAVRAAETLMHGHVAFATLPSLAAELLPEILKQFRLRHSSVRVTVHDVHAEETLQLLRDRRVDFALIGGNPGLKEFAYEEIARELFVVAMATEHPFASMETVSMDEVVTQPQVAIAHPNSVRSYVEAAFISRGLQFSPSFQAENLSTIGALLNINSGVALLSVRAARLATALGGTFRPLADASIFRPIGLLTRADEPPSNAVQAMKELIKEVGSRADTQKSTVR